MGIEAVAVKTAESCFFPVVTRDARLPLASCHETSIIKIALSKHVQTHDGTGRAYKGRFLKRSLQVGYVFLTKIVCFH